MFSERINLTVRLVPYKGISVEHPSRGYIETHRACSEETDVDLKLVGWIPVAQPDVPHANRNAVVSAKWGFLIRNIFHRSLFGIDIHVFAARGEQQFCDVAGQILLFGRVVSGQAQALDLCFGQNPLQWIE